MTGSRRVASPPLPLALWLPGVAVLLATVAVSVRRWSWPYQEWVSTSSQFHESLLFAGPIAAAATTYYAGRLTPRSRIFGRPGATRTAASVAWRHLRACLLTFGAAYVLALLPLIVLTALRAQSGGPDLLVILVSLLGLAALIATGYAIGVLLGGAWPAPLTLVLGLLAMQSTAIDHTRFAAVDPVTNFPAVLGRTETLPITCYRAAFFVVLFTAAFIVATDRLAVRGRGWWLSGGAAALLVVTALGVVIPMRWQPAILVEQADPPAVCRQSGPLNYCVHEGHRGELTAMVDAGNRLLAVYGAPPPGLTRVRDRALAGPDTRLSADTAWVELSPDTPTDASTAGELAPVLAGQNACDLKYPPVNDEATPEPVIMSLSVARAVLHAVGTASSGSTASSGGSASGLDSLSPVELRTWLQAHRTAVDTCSLSARQLP